MFPLFSYYSLLLYFYYYSMPRKTKRRKGSGPVSQFVRNRLGVSMYDSTKEAALEIKNIYANLEDDKKEKNKPVKPLKPQIDDIFKRNFGPSLSSPRDRILKELHKFGEGSITPPKNWMRSIMDIRSWYK